MTTRFHKIMFAPARGARPVQMKRVYHRDAAQAMRDIIAELESRNVALVVKSVQRITTAEGATYSVE